MLGVDVPGVDVPGADVLGVDVLVDGLMPDPPLGVLVCPEVTTGELCVDFHHKYPTPTDIMMITPMIMYPIM